MLLSAKDSFAGELAKDETQINLAQAALLISEHLNQMPNLTGVYLSLLDDLADTLRPAIQSALTTEAKIRAFNHYLFEELRFRGNNENYYDPGNSFLDQVLERRTGIPIALSTICLEVGWRLGLPLVGLGLPGHFIIGYGLPT